MRSWWCSCEQWGMRSAIRMWLSSFLISVKLSQSKYDLYHNDDYTNNCYIDAFMRCLMLFYLFTALLFTFSPSLPSYHFILLMIWSTSLSLTTVLTLWMVHITQCMCLKGSTVPIRIKKEHCLRMCSLSAPLRVTFSLCCQSEKAQLMIAQFYKMWLAIMSSALLKESTGLLTSITSTLSTWWSLIVGYDTI